ncbi:MAG: N-acetyltransferase family protein [Planctomycetota bacterium]
MSTETLTTETTLTIRRAAWEDMEAVAGFLRSTADWYRPFLREEDMAEHDVPEEWKARNFARREFWLGELEGEPVGTVSLQEFGDYAYVGYVYLDAAHVGRGIGRRLLQHAAKQARARGKRGVALIAHPRAVWATRAYRKFGFELVASRREDVLAWNDGALRDYYEEGFELYVYSLAAGGRPSTK